MGRRAKNKQGAPAPLPGQDTGRPSAKKLGKRKAEAGVEEGNPSDRPAKKVKEAVTKTSQKIKPTSKATKTRESKPKSGSGKKGKDL
ncbi:hypothetical protein SERLADRAFT_397909, partial [Serpula lacrymans var. lacrymans S7.9]